MQTYVMSFVQFYLASFRGVSKPCWRGISLSFIESTLMSVFYFLSIYFTKELHLDIKTSAFIISCYGLGAILGGLLGGSLSDKLAPHIVSACSLGLQAIGYAALLFVHATPFLMCDLFVIGIATYSFITANYLSVLGYCQNDEAQRLKVINFLSIASNLGLGLSAILIGELANYGFKSIFLISSSMTLLLAILLIIQSPTNFTATDTHTDTDETSHIRKQQDQKVIWLALTCVLFVGAIVAQLSTTYPIYIANHFSQYGLKAISILFAINSFMVVFIETPVGAYFKDSNKIQMIGVGSFFIGLGMFLLSVSHLFIFAIVSCMLYTLGEIIFFCMAQLVCYQKSNQRKKGHGLGMYRTIYATSRVAGPVLGGYIYANLGGNMLWYISAIIGTLCLFACQLFKAYD